MIPLTLAIESSCSLYSYLNKCVYAASVISINIYLSFIHLYVIVKNRFSTYGYYVNGYTIMYRE
jgi:hypothetical protein